MKDRLSRVVENYEVKLRLGAAGRLTEEQIERRVQRFSIAAANEDMVLNQVRQVLCTAGVVPMFFPAYHAFSREIGKLSRQEVPTETLATETAVVTAKWVMRGLSQPVLRAIACDVFNIPSPVPPAAVAGQAAP
jgi:hypothetical protein